MRRRDRPGALVVALVLAAGAAFLAPPAAAQQEQRKLAPGPGAELVQKKCTLCHDLDNIISIRQSREGWEDTLKVMVRRGAPLSPEEASLILDYLTKQYGK